MEQNANTGVPVAPMVENKQKGGNGLKIATAIACVVAACGIGFGVYGMMQSMQKDSQISALNSEIIGLRQSAEELRNTIVDSDANNATSEANDSSQHHLTLELVKSVCEKYKGELTAVDRSTLYGAKSYYCNGTEGPGIILSNGSQIAIGFIGDGEKDKVWSEIRSTINESEGHEDVSGYVVLEDSDTFIKAYATIAGLARVYIAAYNNAVIEVAAGSDHVVEELLAELGFPDGKRAADYR